MGAKSRTKGAGYEREVCNEIFERLGLRITRKLGQERDSGNDIDLPLVQTGTLRMECKRRARIGNVREWMEQVELAIAKDVEAGLTDPAAGDVPCIVMRADGWGSSLVVLELADFLMFIREELEFTVPAGGGNGDGR
jgi:hypothetical protein